MMHFTEHLPWAITGLNPHSSCMRKVLHHVHFTWEGTEASRGLATTLVTQLVNVRLGT